MQVVVVVPEGGRAQVQMPVPVLGREWVRGGGQCATGIATGREGGFKEAGLSCGASRFSRMRWMPMVSSM